MNTYKATSVFGSFVFSKILLPAVGCSLIAIQTGCSGIRNDAKITRAFNPYADHCRPQTNGSAFGNTNVSQPTMSGRDHIDSLATANNNSVFLSDETEHNQREHNPNS